MKYEILLIIGIAIVAAILGFAFIKDLRHAFIMPEGYAGLLYHKGKFVKVLDADDTSAGVVTSRWARRTCARRRCSWQGRKCSPPTTSVSSSACSSPTK